MDCFIFKKGKTMTITASMPAKAVYLGDGVTVNFPVPFIYFENLDGTKQIKVVLADENGENEVVQEENINFTITASGQINGTLTMNTPPPANYILTILYDIPIEQLTDWKEFGRLPSESIEKAVDKLTAIIKQIYEVLDRCVKVTISGKQTPEELLATVYDKLDSATEVAKQASSAAEKATAAADNATNAAANAVQAAETAVQDIENAVAGAKDDIAETLQQSEASIQETIASAIEDVKGAATAAAQEIVDNAAESATETAKSNLNAYVDETVEPSLQKYVDAAVASAEEAHSYESLAEQKIEEFKTLYETSTSEFETLYSTSTSEFDTNAQAQTSDFNANAAEKQAAVDKSAEAAANSATAAEKSKQDAAAKADAAATSETNAKKSELLAAALAERVRSEGIPMSIIEHKRIEKSGNTVKLYWQDPRNTIIDGYTLASWKSTTIVKKQGTYPEDVDDGEIVAIVTERNRYLDTPLEDTQEDAANWYYRAFPLSVNGVYCLDKRNCFGVVLYGYRINEIDQVPSTRVEYLPYCDNYFYDPCSMDHIADTFSWGSWERAFFVPKPCALKYNGEVDYYLDVHDFTKKADGSASDVSSFDYGGNFMCEFPKIFVKFWRENNYIYVLVSNTKLDDGFECYACKKSDGSYAEHFYLPMFEGTKDTDNRLRSIATNTVPTASTNAETEATYAMANGTGWNTTLWADEMLMILLFPLLFKSTDSQVALGYGASGSSSGLTCRNDAALAKGMMYGTASGNAAGMTYLGLHNWWAHRWRRCNGLMNNKGTIYVKMTPSTIDGSSTDGFNRTGEGYINTGHLMPACENSYYRRYLPVGKYGLMPQTVSGSSTTYYCDAGWANNGQLDQLLLGGSVNNGTSGGVFCFHVNGAPSITNWSFGASPSYHPL